MEHPVVFFPALFGSILYGNIENMQGGPWYCPKNLHNSWIFQTDQYLVSPFDNCLAEYLTPTWNDTTQEPCDRPQTEIYTVDFGGFEGMRYLDRGFLGWHMVPSSIEVLLERFWNSGYTVSKDMFGAPYDWRMMPVVSDNYYNATKELIEKVFNETGKKVTLIGYSGGCWAIQVFLAKKVDQEWKDMYIHKAILCAPSYSGTLFAPEIAFVSWYTDTMRKFFMRTPTMYAHMPNLRIYGNKTILKAPDGREVNAQGIRQFMSDEGRLDEPMKATWKYCEDKVTSDVIEDPGVDVDFVINTGLDTAVTLVFNGTWDSYGFEVEAGDAVINKDGLYWGCDHWKSGHTVNCYDYNINNQSYNHGQMMNVKEVRDDIFNLATADNKPVPGNTVFNLKKDGVWEATSRNR